MVKSAVVYVEAPNPCYNERICYISPLLCLRGQKLQHMAHAQGLGRVGNAASAALPLGATTASQRWE